MTSELRLHFKQTSPVAGDCTASYDVIPNRKCTVRELIEAELANKNSWGYIGLKDKAHILPYPRCEYRWGKLISNDIPNEVLDRTIQSISASGGWSQMDYYITLCPAT